MAAVTPRTFLAPKMREVLTEAARRQEGLRRLFGEQPGKPPWPAHPATLAALVRHGLLDCSENRTRRNLRLIVWKITDAGRKALEPQQIITPDRPLFLARGSTRYRRLSDNRWAVADADSSGDYTSDPHRSIDNDRHPGTEKKTAVEVLVTPADIAEYAQQAREREQARRQAAGRTLDTHPVGIRLQRLKTISRARYFDISSEQRLIRHLLASDREAAALARLVRLEEQLGQRAEPKGHPTDHYTAQVSPS